MPDFNFAENESVETLASVPEKYHGLYTEADGKFTVSDAAKGLVADYTGVSASLAGVRLDKKKVTDENAERRLSSKAVEDFAQTLGIEVGDEGMSTALKTFIDDLHSQVKGGKDLKINLDKVNGEWDKRLQEVTATKDGEIAGMTAALSKHLISDAATTALASAKGSIALLLPHVERNCKVIKLEDGNYTVQVLDAQGDTRFNGSGGFMSVSGLVDEMKTQEAFGRAFESEVPGGSGTPPGSLNRANTNRVDPNREKSPIEKISSGLAAHQAQQGRGTGVVG